MVMYRGVCYYPEAWPSERWDRDIALMKDAGFNLVRMGEFAWSRLETEDGRFELGWWTDVCGRFASAGMRVLAATPSAAPPIWLSEKYPETVAVRPNGERVPLGGRRHYCPSSPRYRERVAAVSRAMAEAVRDNPAVIAWQIDNEIAVDPNTCYCPHCAEGFRTWLQHRYDDLDRLNAAWGNVFWSGEIRDWAHVQPPRCGRLSRVLDYRRFMEETYVSFVEAQARVLREVKTDWPITTNQWAGLVPGMNVTRIFKNLDFAAYDGYWEYYADTEHYSSVWDLYRSLKRKPFWIVETNAWHDITTLDNGLRALRPWAYEAIAKGAEAQVYFRWRQSPMGEEDHPAVLDWSGEPSRAYAELGELNRQISDLAPYLDDLPLPQADVAILHDHTSALLGELGDRDTWQEIVRHRAMFGRLGVQVDILPAARAKELGRYRLIVAPHLEVVAPELVDTLTRFVEQGSVLLAGPRLATCDTNGKYLTDVHPVSLRSLFGVSVVERIPIKDETSRRFKPLPATEPLPKDVSVQVLEGLNATAMSATGFMELARPDPATTVLARYGSGYFKGEAAITAAVREDGRAIYQACHLSADSLRSLLANALDLAGLRWFDSIPAGVEILQRGHLRFYLNMTSTPAAVRLFEQGRALLGEVDDSTVHLGPFDVCIVEAGDPHDRK